MGSHVNDYSDYERSIWDFGVACMALAVKVNNNVLVLWKTNSMAVSCIVTASGRFAQYTPTSF